LFSIGDEFVAGLADAKTVHQILERYLAWTTGLAGQAIVNWDNSPRTEFANSLTTKGGLHGDP
jgi:hypothetical protein